MKAGSLAMGGSRVQVYVERMDEGEFGESKSYPFEWIKVTKGLPRAERAQTLLHEMIHIIDNRFGLSLSESKTRTLEQAFASLIRENPNKARKWLEDMLK